MYRKNTRLAFHTACEIVPFNWPVLHVRFNIADIITIFLSIQIIGLTTYKPHSMHSL
jgi:hypothetical protein